jgi:hypothetical protein
MSKKSKKLKNGPKSKKSKFFSSITNCYMGNDPNKGGPPLFNFPGGKHDGLAEVNLNGLAIIEMEDYCRLLWLKLAADRRSIERFQELAKKAKEKDGG